MSGGMTLQGSRLLKTRCKRLSFCQHVFRSSLRESASLGMVSFSTAHQARASPFLPRRAQRRQTRRSSASRHRTLCQSGWARANGSCAASSRWRVRTALQSSLLTRSTHSVEHGARQASRMLRGGSRQSSLHRWMELARAARRFLSWAQQTHPGTWTLPFGGASRSEYTSRCQMLRRGPDCSTYALATRHTGASRRTSRESPSAQRASAGLTSPSSCATRCTNRFGGAGVLRLSCASPGQVRMARPASAGAPVARTHLVPCR
mmetsp:Transcript_84271/g.272761  ORF Transcript_84271/g.272761 Transcript_84271/m.272761 type:complete len:262 (-) Transcript_84271:562-1347(-)